MGLSINAIKKPLFLLLLISLATYLFVNFYLSPFTYGIYKENEFIETGYGGSKKKSEQDASKNALLKFRVLSE